ncbi:MAG: sigma-70 family RNA polymerase sigma factor [Phycisphaerales bacterium]|nr:sigma-70 family RNA polymerase sigma factor [Phycisphaerales bacterium]
MQGSTVSREPGRGDPGRTVCPVRLAAAFSGEAWRRAWRRSCRCRGRHRRRFSAARVPVPSPSPASSAAPQAEDIAQEAYGRAYARRSRFEGRASVATWLTRIAFHETLRRRRRRAKEAAVLRRIGQSWEQVVRTTEEVEMSGDPHARNSLSQALDALPVRMRTVVILRLAQGLSTRETAACLRLSEANVKVLLHRGTRALREARGAEPVESLREQYAFGAERCDRVVAAVLHRISRF